MESVAASERADASLKMPRLGAVTPAPTAAVVKPIAPRRNRPRENGRCQNEPVRAGVAMYAERQ
jgi:hypothetical protein